jgi:hypothetical protein
MLKAKPIDEFESLILRKRDDIHDFVAATFSANMPTQQMIDTQTTYCTRCRQWCSISI